MGERGGWLVRKELSLSRTRCSRHRINSTNDKRYYGFERSAQDAPMRASGLEMVTIGRERRGRRSDNCSSGKGQTWR